jgi:hypothetical protein
MSLLPGAKRAKHRKPRQYRDFYLEPEWASEQLFAMVPFRGPIHDPACGTGRIVEAARRAGYLATGADITDRGYPGTEIIDFLRDERPRTTVACNPPFIHAEKFIAHALTVASAAVAIFAPIPALCGQGRFAALYVPHPPALVLPHARRGSCPPGDIDTEAEGGTMDYGWLVWSRTPLAWRRSCGLVPNGWWVSPFGTIVDWLAP